MITRGTMMWVWVPETPPTEDTRLGGTLHEYENAT